jgi:hypothetical protein
MSLHAPKNPNGARTPQGYVKYDSIGGTYCLGPSGLYRWVDGPKGPHWRWAGH